MHTAVDRFQAGEGRLTIGTFQSVSTTLLPVLIRRLRNEFPRCDIRISEHEVDFPDPFTVDLLFRDLHIDDAGIEHIKLFDDPYHLVAPGGAFRDGPVELSELDGAPMIAWPPDCAQPAVEESLAINDIHPRIVFRAVGNETVLSMVRAGLGSAILPRLAIEAAGARTDQGLGIHALRPAIPHREIYLVRQADRTLSPLAARATQLTMEIAKNRHLLGNCRQVAPFSPPARQSVGSFLSEGPGRSGGRADATTRAPANGQCPRRRLSRVNRR